MYDLKEYLFNFNFQLFWGPKIALVLIRNHPDLVSLAIVKCLNNVLNTMDSPSSTETNGGEGVKMLIVHNINLYYFKEKN